MLTLNMLTASFSDFIVIGTLQVTKLFSFLKKMNYSPSIELKHSEILCESVQKSYFCPRFTFSFHLLCLHSSMLHTQLLGL